MPKKSLRAVTPGEKAPPAQPKTIGQAADVSERALLVSLRTYLAAEMDKGAVPAHALGGVSAKIREYDREIRAIDSRDDQEATPNGPTPDAQWEAI